MREHGPVTFEAHLGWDPEEELDEMAPDEEPSHGECTLVSYACARRRAELGFDPNDWDDD